MKRLSTLCLAAALAWGSWPARAADEASRPAGEPTRTLLQAYRAAFDNDAMLGAARATAQAGRENVPQARAQLLPNVSASFSRNRNYLDSATPDFLGNISSRSYEYPSSNNSLVMRQPLYRKYQWAQYQQAQVQQGDVEAMLDTEVQNLAIKVTGAYFEALLAQTQLALTRSQLATYQGHLDAARKGFAAGAGTRTDIDEAQARVDLAAAQEIEALQNVDYTRQQLQTLTHHPVGDLADINPGRLELAPPQPQDLEHWVQRAEEASPEMRSLRARAEAAAYDVEKARAGHFPTLDAVVQFARSASENIQSVESSYESRSIGVQLSVPLYAGGGVDAAVRQALANQERARGLLEAGRRDLRIRVYREFRGVTEGVAKVRALEQAVRSAQQALVSSERSFQAGSRTRIDVLNAESARMVALRDLAQARLVYLISSLRLKSLVNEADVKAIEVLDRAFGSALVASAAS